MPLVIRLAVSAPPSVSFFCAVCKIGDGVVCLGGLGNLIVVGDKLDSLVLDERPSRMNERPSAASNRILSARARGLNFSSS
ncbi:MAG: hypothetical protein ABL902_02865 [Gallionella sp.]